MTCDKSSSGLRENLFRSIATHQPGGLSSSGGKPAAEHNNNRTKGMGSDSAQAMASGINTIKEEPEFHHEEQSRDGCYDPIEFDSGLFKTELGLHESADLKKGLHKCLYCSVVFQYASALNRHIVTHTVSKYILSAFIYLSQPIQNNNNAL
jgi:hypothetical protein